MERKFMVYQRRDGFQVAEEATGTRMENGMEFLARPNKSANWCAADFNIVIDDDYELVGEEVIDCSIEPAQVLCFIDGVMKTYDANTIAHAEALRMNEGIDQAFRIIKALDGVYGAASGASGCLMRDDYTDVAYLVSVASRMFGDYDEAHSEALEADAKFNQAHQDEFLSATPMMQAVWINLNHAEALKMNAAI